jgi:hypothetical protein
MIALPTGIRPMSDLLRLTAYDTDGRVLHQTRFVMRNKNGNGTMLLLARQPFGIRVDNGRGILYNTVHLTAGDNYRLAIRATSISDHSGARYQSDFIVLLAVSQFPF